MTRATDGIVRRLRTTSNYQRQRTRSVSGGSQAWPGLQLALAFRGPFATAFSAALAFAPAAAFSPSGSLAFAGAVLAVARFVPIGCCFVFGPLGQESSRVQHHLLTLGQATFDFRHFLVGQADG